MFFFIKIIQKFNFYKSTSSHCIWHAIAMASSGFRDMVIYINRLSNLTTSRWKRLFEFILLLIFELSVCWYTKSMSFFSCYNRPTLLYTHVNILMCNSTYIHICIHMYIGTYKCLNMCTYGFVAVAVKHRSMAMII